MYKKRLLVLASVSFTLLLILGIFFYAVPQEAASSETSVNVGANVLDELNAALVEVTRTALPSVVNISTKMAPKHNSGRGRPQQDPLWEDYFRRFFPDEPRKQQPEEKPMARGSGFIVKEDGYILTNHHVINGADEIKVTLDDEREFDAKLVGTDEETEVAVIKIDAKDLPAMKLGDSDKLQAGEMVLAIGNPFGLSHTVTNGIVSATGRSGVLEAVTYQDFIQTDAAINPGNSGGPLVNTRGEVVGINTAIALATTASGMPIRGNVGIGFAVPINMALDVMNQLIDKGKVERGFLGVSLQAVTKDIAEKYGLKEPRGALIRSVLANGPADKAGIKAGSLMVKFAGKLLEDGDHLMKLVAAVEPGKKVKVVMRHSDGSEEEFEVKLAERTREVLNEFDLEQGGQGERNGDKGEEEWLGITVQELTDALAQRFSYQGQKGVLISNVDPDSKAAKLDNPPRKGDLIQEIEWQEIKNMDDYRKAKEDAKDKESVMVKLRRHGKRGPWYVVIKK